MSLVLERYSEIQCAIIKIKKKNKNLAENIVWIFYYFWLKKLGTVLPRTFLKRKIPLLGGEDVGCRLLDNQTP
jgi:hypothetical protein